MTYFEFKIRFFGKGFMFEVDKGELDGRIHITFYVNHRMYGIALGRGKYGEKRVTRYTV